MNSLIDEWNNTYDDDRKEFIQLMKLRDLIDMLEMISEELSNRDYRNLLIEV